MKTMNTIHSETELSLTEQNRRAAQAVLPHYEPYGIHYLSDRHEILTWARRCWKSDYTMEDLPSTLRWAVGIDACAHVRAENGGYFSGMDSGLPGLFSLSESGSFLEWHRHSKRPVRLFGQPVMAPAHFINFITRNNDDSKSPWFLNLFQPYDEDYYANWTLENASDGRYNPEP